MNHRWVELRRARCEGLRALVHRAGARWRRRFSADTAATAAIPSSTALDEALDRTIAPEVAALVYELLDAHDDTAQLAAPLSCDPYWRAHLDYLRALQRVGRGTLAHMSHEDAA